MVSSLVKIGSPVSPLNACNRLSPSAPNIQTMALERPSVVVAIGGPEPLSAPHQAVSIVGGAPLRIFKTVSSLLLTLSILRITNPARVSLAHCASGTLGQCAPTP